MNRPIVFGLAVAAVACAQGTATPPNEISTPPATLVLVAESLPTFVSLDGSVVPRHRAEISTRMMARVAAVPVDIGTNVRRGDVLIRLGTDDVAAGRRKAEAAVRSARAAWEEATRHAARMDTLLARDAVARVQRDQAHLGRTQAESQLAMADAALREVEIAEAYATIRAPFPGTVVRRAVDPGDVAGPGAPLLVLESAGARDAVVYVPVSLLAEISTGDTLRIDAWDGRSTAAPIRALASGGDPRSRTAEARVALPADWPTGLSLTARVPAGRHVGLAIPATAVVRRGQLTGVRVLDGDDAVIRWVRLGRALGDGRLEVLSGLDVGETILP